MKDIAARELKGHNILAVERFWDSTCWMIDETLKFNCISLLRFAIVISPVPVSSERQAYGQAAPA